MAHEPALAERQALLAQLTSLTSSGSLRLERQRNSAHRYARWSNNLLILGPTASLDDHNIPRYLFLTPLTAPTGIEITTDDEELREPLLVLVNAVEAATAHQAPRDPFAFGEHALSISE
jgi:hypothetical protein